MVGHRVVITGRGVVSPIGTGVGAFWTSLREGRPGIAPIEAIEGAPFRFPNGAQVKDFRAEEHFDAKQLSMFDRFAQFAVVAAREAVAEAGIEWTPELRRRTGIVTGSCTGGQTSEDAAYADLCRGRGRVQATTVPRVMANAGASGISMDLGITGPAFTLATACSSSNHAIGQAFWMVRNGVAPLAIAGGSEAPFTLLSCKSWEALRVVASDTCRPFSRDRTGMILGEGGAMLVLETLESAQARGAHIHGELAGFGMSSDAYELTAPSADGAAAAIEAALRDGGIAPEEVGYINAHGTGTKVNDPMEVAAIRMVFGSHTERLAISSTKSMHGHALGAAGALEAVATLLALEEGILPPTANFTEADPACDVDVVPNEARAARVEVAVSNSFAFGGLNAVLAFRRWER
jgi:nodulation protein E